MGGRVVPWMKHRRMPVERSKPVASPDMRLEAEKETLEAEEDTENRRDEHTPEMIAEIVQFLEPHTRWDTFHFCNLLIPNKRNVWCSERTSVERLSVSSMVSLLPSMDLQREPSPPTTSSLPT